MLLSLWRASPKLAPLATLWKAFDGNSFKPHGIIPTFLVELGGKTVLVEVEAVDAPLGYNLLLVWSWVNKIKATMYSVFPVLKFPHQGKAIHQELLSVEAIQLVFDFTNNTKVKMTPYQAKKQHMNIKYIVVWKWLIILLHLDLYQYHPQKPWLLNQTVAYPWIPLKSRSLEYRNSVILKPWVPKLGVTVVVSFTVM